MTVGRERIWVRFPVDRLRELDKMATTVGLPLSQFVALAAWSGRGLLMYALDPSFRTMVDAAEDEAMAEAIADYEQEQQAQFEALAEAAQDVDQQEVIDMQEYLEWKRQRATELRSVELQQSGELEIHDHDPF